MVRASESTGGGVLLVVDEGPAGLSFLRALETVTSDVEWVRSAAELRLRAARLDLPVPDVVFLDLDLSDATDADLVPMVRDRFPAAAVIALSGDASGEGAARLLCFGVPSLTKPVSPRALAGLAVRLTMDARLPSAWRKAPANDGNGGNGGGRGAHLELVFSSYSAHRVLSKQQQMILRLYLGGMNDKEIAGVCRCSEATVYEHWRRMARKAGGSQKSDVITDFHRFLAGN